MNSLKTALTQALFSQAIMIYGNADVMDCEQVNHSIFLFDTVALLGQVAEIYVDGTPFLVAQETAIRLSVVSDHSELSSLSLDQEFFDSICEDDVRWQIYTKVGAESPKHQTIIVNGTLWEQTEIDFNAVIHNFKTPLTDSLATLSGDDINDELQPLAETIYQNLSNQNFGKLVA